MPLLRREPFQRKKAPSNLKPDEQFFFCKLTKEIFRDYEEFFERIILCNSLVWSCELTGRPNLTFQEALDSEKKAKKCLGNFPAALKKPLLFLATLTRRVKMSDLWEDVFQFVKDHYFVGENVEAVISGNWTKCYILKVIPPTDDRIDEYMQECEERCESDPYACILPGSLYCYEVEELSEDSDSCDSDIQSFHIVTFTQIKRLKGVYSRDKSRLYLKQCCEMANNGYWTVKPSLVHKHGLNDLLFEDIYAGPVPSFPWPYKNRKSKDSFKDDKKRYMKQEDKRKSKEISMKRKLEEEREAARIKTDEEKRRKLEEKAKEREKKKEERRLLMEYKKEWSRPREDLECDDLKELPVPAAVHCRIPNHIFGDFMMVLEFIQSFSDLLGFGTEIPLGTGLFDLLERAIVEQEVHGPFSELLQLLLRTVFMLQEEEDEEIGITASDTDLISDAPSEIGAGFSHHSTRIYSLPYLSLSLKDTPLDPMTLSEILRIFFLLSGSNTSENNAKWRYQQRGGYTQMDDPGLEFKKEEKNIMRSLAFDSVYDLSCSDKLKVIKCLIHQILTYAMIRDHLDEKFEKVRILKSEMRFLQQSQMKKEREEGLKKKAHDKPENNINEVESEIMKQKREKEEARKRLEYQRKEKDLLAQLRSVQKSISLFPVGRDRAFRRFWIFSSLPGLFVEHDDEYVGDCLDVPTHISSKMLSHNGIKQNGDCLVNGNGDMHESSPSPLVCVAEIENCPVHCTYLPRTKWSFYWHADDLDKLIDALNPRGFRERELRDFLIQDRQSIVASLSKCPVHKLDQSHQVGELSSSMERKSDRHKERKQGNGLQFPSGTPVNTVLELTLRDFILDLEEKIHLGGLGSLKIDSRLLWRETLESQGEVWIGRLAPKDYLNIENSLIQAQSKESSDSRCGSPASVEGASCNGEEDKTVSAIYAVRCLAKAIKQLAQGVEPKYLTAPLGESDKDRKKRLKEEEKLKGDKDEEEDGPDVKPICTSKTNLERWMSSLNNSISLPQLYLHLNTLESSITWSRSVLKARCRICRRKGDEDKMLLCDGCDKGHHIYCLKPPLKKIPEGDWFCSTCCPKEIPKAPKKNRKIFLEEEEEDEDLVEEVEEEEFENEEDEIMEEDIEEESYDMDGLYCEDLDQSENIPLVEVCAQCNEPGTLLCCDTCPLLFHLECADPPLKRVPKGTWSCHKCQTPSTSEASSPKEAATPTKIRLPPRSRSGGRKLPKEDEFIFESFGDHGKRRSASEAKEKISRTAKRLRSDDSADGSESDSREAVDTTSSKTKGKRNLSLRRLAEQNDLPLHYAALDGLLTDLAKHADSWPFLRAVTRKEAPDYHDIIKRPMDLGTMQGKLNSMQYGTNSEFMADALLIFQNCRLYNRCETPEYRAGCRLVEYLEKRAKELGLQFPIDDLESIPPKKSRP